MMKSQLIYGKDETKLITNISYKDNKIYIYKASNQLEIIDYKPWIISKSPSPKYEHTKLKGNQYYRYLTHLDLDVYKEVTEGWNNKVWAPRSIEEGFMLLNGYTYFKDLKINQVSLLSFDIEATSLDPDDPKAEVLLISTTFRDRCGSIQRKLFDKFETDNIVSEFSDYVRKMDPDVLLGHNIFGYDIKYLSKHGKLILGRDNSEITFNEKASKFRKDANQQYEYYGANVHGRTIVDTFFLSIKYDIGRSFPSYGLKQIEKHLGLVDGSRIEWDFTNYPTNRYKDWPKGKWEEFRQYCNDDSDSPIKMFDLMGPSFFYLNVSVPKTFQQMITENSGSQIDSMMIRSYLQNGYSQPRTSQKEPFEGAISMGIPGIYKHVKKADVSSLYPSIMLQYNIYDKKKDPNKHLLVMLEYFRDERLKNKALGEAGSVYNQQLSDSQKIYINSTYGYLGAGYLLYNYPVGASEVTKHGRELLLKGVEWSTGHTLKKVVKKIVNKGKENEEIKYEWVLGDKVCEGQGYQLSNVDTDSFSITNGKETNKEEFKEFLTKLNAIFPKLISWEDDGVYSNFIIIAAKNYVLKKHRDWCKPKDLDKNGEPKVKYKGASITDQKKEATLQKFLKDMMVLILNGNPEDDMVNLYNSYCLDALNPKSVNDWCVKKTITGNLLTSKRPNETKVVDACNDAIKRSVLAGIQEGDKVYLYQTIDGEKQAMAKGELLFAKDGSPKMVPNQILRVPELYNNDMDSWHYVERVYKTVKILENILDMKIFPKYSLKSNRKKLENLLNKC